jgi:polysaccharide biosynthesis transport protein
MGMSGGGLKGTRPRTASADAGLGQVSIEHYLRLIFHRKLLIVGVFAVVSAGTFIVSSRLPDMFVSETVILVDPQKVPDAYVKSTVTGDVRNRLGTLSQQILSATRLQKIIDTLNLYPEDRKTMAREDVITRMRHDISVQVVSDFGGGQDLQAFRIRYSGKEPRLVAQVTNELASLFIEENLKAREQQASGTSDFLQSQLQETRKALETQEARLKDFKLKHLGEMPEHQTATMQILGQLQSQLQLESDALSRAEQQRAYIQSMAASQTNAPVVDLDENDPQPTRRPGPSAALAGAAASPPLKARLAAALSRYSEDHPDVRRLRRQIQDEEAKQARTETAPVPDSSDTQGKSDSIPRGIPSAAPPRRQLAPARYVNPVLESQLRALEAEITKRKEEQQRLMKAVAGYRTKLEAVPVREQQMTELVRDYEMSKAHYQQLLDKQLSADTATQLEIRQKGERFTVLDPAQPAQKPSSPNRALINAAGSIAGLVIGLALALATEFLGMAITGPEQVTSTTGLPVLEVIPLIHTHTDRMVRRRRLFYAAVSALVLVIASCAAVLYHYRYTAF